VSDTEEEKLALRPVSARMPAPVGLAETSIFRPAKKPEPIAEPKEPACEHIWRVIPCADEKCDSCGVQKSQLQRATFLRVDSYVTVSRGKGGKPVFHELSCADGTRIASSGESGSDRDYLARWQASAKGRR